MTYTITLQRGLLMLISIVFLQCSPKYTSYYREVTKAQLWITDGKYDNAIKAYDKSLTYNNAGTLPNNLSAYHCAVLLKDTVEQVKYYTLIQQTLECAQYLEDLKKEGSFTVYSPKTTFRKSDRFGLFTDSLINVDQDNREHLGYEEKALRDSLHLLELVHHIKQYGLPPAKDLSYQCFSSGTGYDMYKFQLFLVHFYRYRNSYLDSILVENYKNMNFEHLMLAQYCNTIQDETRLGSIYKIINDTLYVHKDHLPKFPELNKNRKKYGLPTIEEEYKLVKYRDEVRAKGFSSPILVFKIYSESFPRKDFIVASALDFK